MYRIIDLTDHPGIYATRLMAEAGNEVIRVEPPDGDEIRRLGPFVGGSTDLESGAYHQFLNAGKRSLALDLDDPSHRDAFQQLVKTADALVLGGAAPVSEQLVLDANPDIVLVRVVNDEPELCAFARSGLLALTGHPGQRPTLLGGHLVYCATGMFAGIAAMGALLSRDITGQGQRVDVYVRQCMESLVEQSMIEYQAWGRVAQRVGMRGAITATSGAFPCADGYWMVSVPASPEGWAKFIDWTQDPVLSADPSLQDEAERFAKKDLVIERIGAWSQRFTKAELVERAQERHVPASPVSTTLDLVDDPQLIDRGFLANVHHPIFGETRFPLGAIATLWGTDLRPAPGLGQDNEALLAELAGRDIAP